MGVRKRKSSSYPGNGATPLWLAKNPSLTNLESLHLQDCAAVKLLPPFQTMPFLTTLSLVGLSSLNDFHIDFRSYEKDELELSEIEILKCSALITSIGLHSCKALTKLSITNCGALASLELEGMPSSDQLMLNIQGCSQLPSGFISNWQFCWQTTTETICKYGFVVNLLQPVFSRLDNLF